MQTDVVTLHFTGLPGKCWCNVVVISNKFKICDLLISTYLPSQSLVQLQNFISKSRDPTDTIYVRQNLGEMCIKWCIRHQEYFFLFDAMVQP